MHGSCFRDVHNLAVSCDNEYKPIQRLQTLLERITSRARTRTPQIPTFSFSLKQLSIMLFAQFAFISLQSIYRKDRSRRYL